MTNRKTNLVDTWRAVLRLPGRARSVALLLLGSAALPTAAVAFAATGKSPVARFLEAHPGFVNLIAVCVSVVGLLVFEPPRCASPLAYARQLRARFLELQSTFDADDRRHPGEGKEKEDDHVPSEP